MVDQFTRYLLQFHQLYLSTVGTLRLVQQPAVLDVAGKRIQPPFYTITFSNDGWLSRHQVAYFSEQLMLDEEGVRHALDEAGSQLMAALTTQPFDWKGIGTFHLQNETVAFVPHPQPAVLQPVVAERVLRSHVQHTVLVGDQLVLSDGQSEPVAAEEKAWSWSFIIGWGAVVLSLFFILFYLYQHQFQSTASGMRQRINAEPPAATYQQQPIP